VQAQPMEIWECPTHTRTDSSPEYDVVPVQTIKDQFVRVFEWPLLETKRKACGISWVHRSWSENGI